MFQDLTSNIIDDLLLFAAIANKQKSLGKFRCVLSSKTKTLPLAGFMTKMVQLIVQFTIFC